jgi:hypothetical protein
MKFSKCKNFQIFKKSELRICKLEYELRWAVSHKVYPTYSNCWDPLSENLHKTWDYFNTGSKTHGQQTSTFHGNSSSSCRRVRQYLTCFHIQRLKNRAYTEKDTEHCNHQKMKCKYLCIYLTIIRFRKDSSM